MWWEWVVPQLVTWEGWLGVGDTMGTAVDIVGIAEDMAGTWQ